MSIYSCDSGYPRAAVIALPFYPLPPLLITTLGDRPCMSLDDRFIPSVTMPNFGDFIKRQMRSRSPPLLSYNSKRRLRPVGKPYSVERVGCTES